MAQDAPRPPRQLLGLRRYALALAVGWTVVIVGLILFGARHEIQTARELASHEAHAHFQKDRSFRLWGAAHGGVYVPLTENTPPNPYLAHIPTRDIETTAGRKLTLMNSAYMMRQLMEDYQQGYGVRGRITSLKPLRPENSPDEWERAALESFERGETEARDFTEIDGEPYLRLMHPMVVAPACLKCHAQQGYQEGDIRGGVGVSVALSSYLASAREDIAERSAGLGLIWLLGMAGIGFVAVHVARAARGREQDAAVLREKTTMLDNILRSASDVAIATADLDFRITYYNPMAEKFFGYTAAEAIGKTVMAVHTTENIAPERFERAFEIVRRDGEFRYSLTQETEDGPRYLDSRVAGVFDPGGELVGYSLFSRDVTARKRAAEALQESEERYRAVAEDMPVLICRFLPGGEITYVNRAYCKSFEKTSEALIGSSLLSLIPEEDRERVLENIASLTVESPTQSHERQLIAPDGEIRWQRWTNRALFDAAGQPRAYQSIGEDVTERKQREEELERERQQLALVLEGARIGWWDWDIPSGKEFYNEILPELLGYELNEIEPHVSWWEEKIHPDDLDQVGQDLQKHFDGETEFYVNTHRLQTKSGEWKWFLDHGQVVERDSDGKPLRMLGTIRDIDEQQRAEDELRFQAMLLDSISDQVTATDLDGRITYVNQAECDKMGRSRDEIVGQLTEIYGDDPDEGATQREIVETTREKGAWQGEVINFIPSGERIIIECRTRLLRDASGKPTGMCGVARDITERKRTEEALRESEDRYRTLAQSTVDWVWAIDSTGKHTFSNGTIKNLLGFEVSEVVGKSSFPLMHLEDKDRVLKMLEVCVEQEKGWVNVGIRWIHKDGSIRLFESTAQPLFDQEKRLVGFTGIDRDVTERKRAEEALAESEDRYRSILDDIDEGYYEVDLAGNFTFFNDSTCQILGYSRDELMGMNNRQYMDNENAAAVYRTFNDVFRTAEQAHSVDWQLIKKDGSVCSIESSMSLMHDPEDVPIGFRGIFRDITRRKRAEESLRVSEEKHRQLVQNLPAGVVVHAPDTSIILANERASVVLGLTLDQMRGKTAMDPARRFFHEDGSPMLLEEYPVNQVLSSQAPIRDWVVGVYRPVTSDHAWVLVNAFPETHADGTISRIVVTFVDISERKRAEKSLRVSEEQFRLLVENSPLGVMRSNAGGDVTYANPAMCDIYQVEDQKELLGNGWERFHGSEGMDIVARENEKRPKGITSSYELEVQGKRGARSSLLVSGGALIAPDGTFLGTVASFLDVTERKRAAEERLSLERQVQRSQKLESLGVLAGGIAHDFNNILMAVLGYADLAIQDLAETHPALSSVREIEKGARRAADLTRQMLAYSGKGRFVIEAMDVSALMDDMAHLLRTSIPRTITLNLQAERSLPPIEADAAQMQQIVMNLITNASEAIGEAAGVMALSTGQLECTKAYLAQSLVPHASSEEAPAPGVYVYFEVSDTGCGIDEETRAKIFEPFFTTKFTGRGLGMAAVLGIVRGHKGALMLDSEPGKGATFRVLFPAVEEKEQAGRSQAVRRADEAGPVSPEGGTILVVDDEKSVRKLTTAILERLGFMVLNAADGREAVEVFREHAGEIACVLLDLTMPHMDGEACFMALRQIKDDAKVILSSGYNEQELRQRFAGSGMAGFIQKPYSMATLKEKLKAVLPAGK